MATDILIGELDQQTEKSFESSRAARSPDGWITPNGVFYSCTAQEHDVCAQYLLKAHRKLIDSLLLKNEHYDMRGEDTDYNPREILKAAGFALLSDNLLSETNSPEKMTLKLMEFIERNHITFMPESGQLSLESYLSFQDMMKRSEGAKQLLERGNIALKGFLDDPTHSISIQDDDSFAEELLGALTEGYTAQVTLKLSKGKIIWRRLNIPNHEVFLEYDYHDHTAGGSYESSPETEVFIFLTDKKGVNEFIEKRKRRDFYPQGDLNALK